jgi:hypothetical protein
MGETAPQMEIYISIGGGKTINQYVIENNLGWCLAPDNVMNPGGQKYFHDCGTFHAECHGKVWASNPFKRLLNKYPNYAFAVLPDKPQINLVYDLVKQRKLAMDSLKLSLSYLGEITRPVALAVQPGMMQSDIRLYMNEVDVIFVGGPPEWKQKTALDWANLAHLYKKKCHVGRVNQYETLRFMHYCGVDSVDGSTASRHDDPSELIKYFNHLKYQQTLTDTMPSELVQSIAGSVTER